MPIDPQIEAGARTLASIGPLLGAWDSTLPEVEIARAAQKRGYFLPDEDEAVLSLFSRYLPVRAALYETIEDLRPVYRDEKSEESQAAFLVSFTAACLLVRTASRLVGMFADAPVIRKKLDQGEPRFGLPRKQYTAIHGALTDPAAALRLRWAREYSHANRSELEALASDPVLKPVVELWQEHSNEVERDMARWVRQRFFFQWMSWRRRNRSAGRKIMFALSEIGGRFMANVHNPWHEPRVDQALRRELDRLLRPGDVIVTRHSDAGSNYFLPGYWPHAALYTGSPQAFAAHLDDAATERMTLIQERHPQRFSRFRFLEGLRDGIYFRRLSETLTVDSLVAIRPRLDMAEVGVGLSRAISHEGKFFDFEFDFTRSDRIVCTELVYRGFNGLGSLDFHLTSRMGRMTFSAEDLLDQAVDDRGYEVVALFSPDHCAGLLVGEEAAKMLPQTYRPDRPPGDI